MTAFTLAALAESNRRSVIEMFLRIDGNLTDVFGDSIRSGNTELLLGIRIRPEYQKVQNGNLISIAKVVDQDKIKPYLSNPGIQILTLEEANEQIDMLLSDEYMLVDSTALMVDLQLSGKTAADIEGYNTSKSLSSQENLKALYNAGVAGVVVRKKPPYLS